MKPGNSAVILAAALIGSSNALTVGNLVGDLVGLLPSQLQLGLNNVDQSNELRLLEFSETEKDWYTEQEMLQFKRQGRRFFDITDHVDFYESSAVGTATTNAGSAVSDTPVTVEFPKELAHVKDVHKISHGISKANLNSTLTEFSSFYTRYAKSDHGLESSLWLFTQINKIAEKSDLNVTVELFDHDWQQKSIIASIPGSKNPDHIVVVGAHQDSINLLMPSLLPAPGADDDGSGTVTTLEIFRVLIESGFKPENTVQFHWYSAEELGLWGSQAIFNSYAADGVDVKAMLQQDMTGYSAGSYEADGKDSLGLITDFVDQGLTDFIRLVVDTYCDIPYVETECGYACSDHASAAKVGYPSAFVIESSFGTSDHYIHSTKDTVDRLDFEHMYQHAKLTLGFAYELGFADFS